MHQILVCNPCVTFFIKWNDSTSLTHSLSFVKNLHPNEGLFFFWQNISVHQIYLKMHINLDLIITTLMKKVWNHLPLNTFVEMW